MHRKYITYCNTYAAMWGTCSKHLVKIDRVVPGICSRRERQTHRHDHQNTPLSTFQAGISLESQFRLHRSVSGVLITGGIVICLLCILGLCGCNQPLTRTPPQPLTLCLMGTCNGQESGSARWLFGKVTVSLTSNWQCCMD